MEARNIQGKIEELEREIAALPAGSLAAKKVNGHLYTYHRWYENGKRRERYVAAADADELRELLNRRKELESELKRLKRLSAQPALTTGASVALQFDSLRPVFQTAVRSGQELQAFAKPVRAYKTRNCFGQLFDYVTGSAPNTEDKVFILYGLRRTGKTTMIRQVLLRMDQSQLEQTAFMQVTPQNSVADVNRDLTRLQRTGIRTVFIDEVTLLSDFIEGAALFSDIFAASGMRIVLSGTDSLGFLFSESEQLYDRCVLLHTTHIPYREFERVLGITGIDEYIRFGGTMSLGGVEYNKASTFANAARASEYVNASIARNIQHSLRCYQHAGHFRSLQDLYEHNELTSAINRVVEDINHRFTLEVLSRDFSSHDLGISASNLRRDRTQPTDILDRVDTPAITEQLRHLLEIRNAPERTVKLTEAHVAEIKEYLGLLDLTYDIQVRSLVGGGATGHRTAIAQPGLRYAQADALVQSLLLDEAFGELSLVERNAVLERIRSEIRGRMLEDIALLETALAQPEHEVFALQFAVGEFDMVVFDPEAAACEIYEIKHSTQVAPQQYRHLTDPQKRAATEHRYGPIRATRVLYRGQSTSVGAVDYLNVEDYLREL